MFSFRAVSVVLTVSRNLRTSSKLTLSTGRFASVNLDGLSPIIASHCVWVTSVRPMRKVFPGIGTISPTKRIAIFSRDSVSREFCSSCLAFSDSSAAFFLAARRAIAAATGSSSGEVSVLDVCFASPPPTSSPTESPGVSAAKLVTSANAASQLVKMEIVLFSMGRSSSVHPAFPRKTGRPWCLTWLEFVVPRQFLFLFVCRFGA